MVKAGLPFFIAVLGVGVRAVAAAEKLTRAEALYWIKIHAWLMWTSFGLLFPLGVILLRYSRPQTSPTAIVSPARVRRIIIGHYIVQSVAVVFGIAGCGVLFSKMGNVVSHTHQKLGLALFIIVLIMPCSGLLRPTKACYRSVIYFSRVWGSKGNTIAAFVCGQGRIKFFVSMGKNYNGDIFQNGVLVFVVDRKARVILLVGPSPHHICDPSVASSFHRGTQLRQYWFFIHWLFGTGAVILGIVNIFIGIFIYQVLLRIPITSLNIAFTIQVAVMGLVYCLQDKWSYILGQGHNENSKGVGKARNTDEFDI